MRYALLAFTTALSPWVILGENDQGMWNYERLGIRQNPVQVMIEEPYAPPMYLDIHDQAPLEYLQVDYGD